jgi:anti-anti-sigma regulatory factor
VRSRGVIDAAVGLVPGDHVCWAYEDDDALIDTIRSWATDGIAGGERVLYIAERSTEELRRRVDVLEDLDELIDARRVTLGSPSAMYGDGPVDDLSLLTYYASATAEALADGCTGLRVAAEVTELEGPTSIEAFVAWEQLADSFMNRSAMSALCAFDRRTVSAAAIAAVAAAHPSCHGAATDTPFVLHSHEDGLRLAGDVETFDRFRLDAMLRTAPIAGTSVVLHLDDLRHASGACARALHAFARRLGDRGGQLVFKGAPAAFRDAWATLGFGDDDVVFA